MPNKLAAIESRRPRIETLSVGFGIEKLWIGLMLNFGAELVQGDASEESESAIKQRRPRRRRSEAAEWYDNLEVEMNL